MKENTVVTIKKSRFVPEFLQGKKAIITKYDNSNCVYVDVEGTQYKLYAEDLQENKGYTVSKGKIVKLYTHIDVRTKDNSKTKNRIIVLSLKLEGRKTRKEAILFAESQLKIKGINLQDKTFQLY